MKKAQTMRMLRKNQIRFCDLNHPDELAILLRMEPLHLQMLSALPVYTEFAIPKRDGSKRYIEDPYPPLKKVQRILNLWLQSVYHVFRTEAAYGFLINAVDEPQPRTILTNAKQHIGKRFLLNVDLEDFFHHVSSEKIQTVFQHHPFDFDDDLTDLLVRLTTRHQRLPMGAPTSPILSNFAAIPLDYALLEHATTHMHARYTRYADDLVFSSNDEIDIDEVHRIWSIIAQCGFVINEDKVKYYREHEPREVTGLTVTDRVDLPANYLPGLRKEIEKLRHILEANLQFHTLQSNVRLREIKQAVRGHIAFAQMVLGDESERIVKLLDSYEKACDPADDFISASWLEFDYM